VIPADFTDYVDALELFELGPCAPAFRSRCQHYRKRESRHVNGCKTLETTEAETDWGRFDLDAGRPVKVTPS